MIPARAARTLAGQGYAVLTPEEFRALEPEKTFMQKVIRLARVNHWLVYHTRDSRGSFAGFPDLLLVKAGALIFAECKSEIGKVSRAQELWIAELRAVPGITVAVWRPSDWPEIERLLGGAA